MLKLPASPAFSQFHVGGALYFEARNGPWSIALDGIYVDLNQPSGPRYPVTAVCVGPDQCHPVDSMGASGSLASVQGVLEGFVFRRISKPVELMVGGMGVHVRATLSGIVTEFSMECIAGVCGPGGYTYFLQTRKSNATWGAPVIGARWTPLDEEHWHVLLFGDLGGLSGNNWTWQVLPSVSYHFSRAFELGLQYRALATNYTTYTAVPSECISTTCGTGGSGGVGVAYTSAIAFRYDMVLYGPQIAFGFHF